LPHISYHAPDELRYARYNGSSWQIQTIDVGLRRGGLTSLKLDQHNRPHIGYFDATSNGVKYAYYDGASWQIEVLATGLEPENESVSLALDIDGRPHICYGDYMEEELRYAYRVTLPLLPETGASVAILWVCIGAGVLASLGVILRQLVRGRIR
jgi:hypothetical protein